MLFVTTGDGEGAKICRDRSGDDGDSCGTGDVAAGM
jgi:hypothetical protein